MTKLDIKAAEIAAGNLAASTTEKLAVWLAHRPPNLTAWAAGMAADGIDDLAAWNRLDDGQREWVVARSPLLSAVAAFVRA